MQSIRRFNPETGEFEITSGGTAAGAAAQKDLTTARKIKGSYDLLYKTIPECSNCFSKIQKMVCRKWCTTYITNIGDQIAQLGEINVPKTKVMLLKKENHKTKWFCWRSTRCNKS